MKKTLILASLLMPAIASAEVNLVFPAGTEGLSVAETKLSPESSDMEPVAIELTPEGTAVYAVRNTKAACVTVRRTTGERPVAVAQILVASPDENITVTVDADGNCTYTGTALMEGISAFDRIINPFYDRIRAVMRNESQEDPNALEAEFNETIKAFMAANATQPVWAYALLNLDDDDFMAAYEGMTPQQRESILMPNIEKKKVSVEKSIALKKLYKQLESGAEPAPAFTLPDPEGKMISLSDFRGKWVILDFWGSWCGWCIKGIPELKEAYKQYAGHLEVIGIDCRDDREDWLAAIKKYDLPWVHVYNDMENTDTPDRVDRLYGVQGFPTKVIINPEGYVSKIVVGEDPAFYTSLSELMK